MVAIPAPTSNAVLSALDLCAGAGGLSLGLQRAGFDVLGVEVNTDACETHRANVGPCEEASIVGWHPPHRFALVAVVAYFGRAANSVARVHRQRIVAYPLDSRPRMAYCIGMKTLVELRRDADEATNAYFRSLPGGRRGWKRTTNAKRTTALLAAMVAAQKAYRDALLGARASEET